VRCYRLAGCTDGASSRLTHSHLTLSPLLRRCSATLLASTFSTAHLYSSRGNLGTDHDDAELGDIQEDVPGYAEFLVRPSLPPGTINQADGGLESNGRPKGTGIPWGMH
jgi:hypothetical protein